MFTSSDLELVSSGGYVHPEDPGEIGMKGEARGSISDAECEILAVLAKGKMVVEIGTGLAVSTRALASTALEVSTIDPDPWVMSNVHTPEVNIRRLTEWDDTIPESDLAFIDGNHSAESVREDICRVKKVIRPGGLIVLHDFIRISSVAEGAVGYPVFTIHTEFGLGVIQCRIS